MTVKEISVKEARKHIKINERNHDFVILDVRTPAEYAEQHLKGAVNINIYYDHFKKNLLKLDKKKTYLVHCHAGVRCFMAAEIMESIGFARIYSVTGNLLG